MTTQKVTGTKVYQTESAYIVELYENDSVDPTRIVVTYKVSGKTEFIDLSKGASK